MKRIFAGLVLWFLICGMILPQDESPEMVLEIRNEFWEGAKWCYNNGPYEWFPEIAGGSFKFGLDNYCCLQLRTKKQISNGQLISFELNPVLEPEQVNGVGGYYGFGNEWAVYEGRFVGIYLDEDFGIWLFDSGEGGKIKKIGNYKRHQWQKMELSLSKNGEFKVVIANKITKYTFNKPNLLNRFIIAEGNSHNAFLIRAIKTEVEKSILSEIKILSKYLKDLLISGIKITDIVAVLKCPNCAPIAPLLTGDPRTALPPGLTIKYGTGTGIIYGGKVIMGDKMLKILENKDY